MNKETIVNYLKNQKDISAWEITEIHKISNQAYLIREEIESLRKVTTNQYLVSIYREYFMDGKKRMGESTVVIDEHDSSQKIERAVAMAEVVANDPFSLPAPGASYPEVSTVDAAVDQDPQVYIEKIISDLSSGVQEDVRLSSSEIFIDTRRITLLNSFGLEASRKETGISVNFVLLTKIKKSDEVEIEGKKDARFYEDLAIIPSMHQYAGYARDAASSQLPPTGVFTIVFSEEALDTFFNYFIGQSSAVAKYQGWGSFEKEKPIAEDVVGDRMTLFSNPLLPGGMKSRSFDINGLPLHKIMVIEDNIFKEWAANKRYADYLNIAPTGDFTNCEVLPGINSRESFFQEGPVIHCMRFSTFTPHAITGAFSGEIRTGYLMQDGKSIPIKGGSVSGTFKQAMHNIRFSREIAKRQSYLGPSAIKVANLRIAGK
ncbi:MAG: metallopeptidase TldD-related protein [bacterium]